MNVTNFANLFHQNSIFQQTKPLEQKLVQPPINDTLHRLSENLLNAKNQARPERIVKSFSGLAG